jgi:hypothetical protein
MSKQPLTNIFFVSISRCKISDCIHMLEFDFDAITIQINE